MLVRFCATPSLNEIFQTLVTDFRDAKSAMADMFLHTSMCGVIAIRDCNIGAGKCTFTLIM
jgi:hypothetical protein